MYGFHTNEFTPLKINYSTRKMNYMHYEFSDKHDTYGYCY